MEHISVPDTIPMHPAQLGKLCTHSVFFFVLTGTLCLLPMSAIQWSAGRQVCIQAHLSVAGQCLLIDSAVLIDFRILCRHQPELRINIHIQWAGPGWLSSPEPGPGIRPEPAKHPS